MRTKSRNNAKRRTKQRVNEPNPEVNYKPTRHNRIDTFIRKSNIDKTTRSQMSIYHTTQEQFPTAPKRFKRVQMAPSSAHSVG